MKSINLFKKTATGAIQIWSISALVDTAQIIIRYGQYNGKQQERVEQVKINKSGRSIREQMVLRIKSRISKQKAKGYRKSIEEAMAYENKNELNRFKPMLAQQFNKQKRVNTNGAVLQRKLDGNRMLVTRSMGDINCYTRNGKPIQTLDHIVEQMNWLIEGQTVDGEIYMHGMDLKDINSRVKKKQSGTLDLNYHIYDVIDDRPFKERFGSWLNYTQEENESRPNLVIEPYWSYVDEDSAQLLFNTSRRQGYEGLMMRLDGYGYEPGKRSKSLLKIKYRYDAEFPVIDVEVGSDGAGILVMRLPNGKVVKGTAPGTRPEKIHVAENPDEYISKLCTCSFAYLTEYGIPFHLTCDRWR